MQQTKGSRQSELLIRFLVGVWLSCCIGAAAVLMVYSHTPGEAGAAAAVLDDTSVLNLDPERPTLVMYLHPRCPCSKASLEELARLQRRWPDRFAIRTVYAIPQGVDKAWHRDVLWERAGTLTDCQRIEDRGAVLTQTAGAVTSGTVGLYEPDGRLAFWGGITPSRGHAGDSVGSDALAGYLGGDPYNERAAVYGCPIDRAAGEGCVIETHTDCGVNHG